MLRCVASACYGAIQPAYTCIQAYFKGQASFEDIRLKRRIEHIVSYVFQTTAPVTAGKLTLQLSGTANFGTTTQFGAYLYFIDTNPVLVEVSLTQTPPLGIGALLAKAAELPYPSEYFDIKFLTGSAYYYKKDLDGAGIFADIELPDKRKVGRSEGFNLQTTLAMFDRRISLAANVQSVGLTATGKMLESFDLSFVEFTHRDFTGSPLLFLRVLKNEKAFGLRAGFKFFQERFATGELSIGKYSNAGNDEAQIKGRLAYAGDIEMFAGTALGFTYSKGEGFKITDWPFDFGATLDYAKLMNGFKTGACSALVDHPILAAEPRKLLTKLTHSCRRAIARRGRQTGRSFWHHPAR